LIVIGGIDACDACSMQTVMLYRQTAQAGTNIGTESAVRSAPVEELVKAPLARLKSFGDREWFAYRELWNIGREQIGLIPA
jgi:hypothetical protein